MIIQREILHKKTNLLLSGIICDYKSNIIFLNRYRAGLGSNRTDKSDPIQNLSKTGFTILCCKWEYLV